MRGGGGMFSTLFDLFRMLRILANEIDNPEDGEDRTAAEVRA